MTKQEAAALLRAGPVTEDGTTYLTNTDRLAIADLLDPPREGLVKVQIALAWNEEGVFEVYGFGPNSWNDDQDSGFINLTASDYTVSPTVITAYVPRPDRTVAQVEGEVEG